MNAKGRQFPGFTLVEMMFSLMLGALILLLATALLGWSGSRYSRTHGDGVTRREGRTLFDRLGEDLASAVLVNGEMLDSTASGGIAFVTLLPAAAQSAEERIGDACTVAYRLEDFESGGRTRRCLVRCLRESRETFEALRSDETGRLFTGKFPIEEPLAFDVIGFEAKPKSVADGGEWRDWADLGQGAPDALEITLVLARPELAGHTRTTADWDALARRVTESRHAGVKSMTETLRFGNHARR